MLSASYYIIACSTRNRIKRWLKRLREPRYAIFALVGAAYFYSIVYIRTRTSSAQQRRGRGLPSPLDVLPALRIAGPVVGGLGVFLMAASSWLFPGTGGLLDFSRAEEQFLFPAPVTRRSLLLHRMMRSQIGLLIASMISAVVVPLGSSATRLRLAITMWILLFATRAYFSAVILTKSRMASWGRAQGRANRRPETLVVVICAIVLVPIIRGFLMQPTMGANEMLTMVSGVTARGLPHYMLWPFVALVQPLFASGWIPFFRALPPAILVLAVCITWVLASDRAFEDVSAEAALRRQDQPQRKRTAYRARAMRWTLAPTGRVEIAFAWKGFLQTMRVVDRRVFTRVILIVAWIAIAIVSTSRGRGLAAVIGLFATTAAMMSIIVGPLVMRLDLRQDLQHLELLKTWPVRAGALVRGEMFWPAALLTMIAWAMTGLALFLSAGVFSRTTALVRIVAAIAVGLMAPTLIAMQLAIHNAAAVMFPAWMSPGAQRSRGVDAVGQRLILVGGTLLIVSILSLPGVAAGGIIWFAFERFLGPTVLIFAAVVCSVIVGVEVLVITEALGPAYERLDLTAIERNE